MTSEFNDFRDGTPLLSWFFKQTTDIQDRMPTRAVQHAGKHNYLVSPRQAIYHCPTCGAWRH